MFSGERSLQVGLSDSTVAGLTGDVPSCSILSQADDSKIAAIAKAGTTGATTLLLVLKFFILNEFIVDNSAQSDTKIAVDTKIPRLIVKSRLG
ncbi:MAG TPA: hypothetical protein DD383_05910 [Rikenellaceae bacterium]|nr:hypothetical protein [Rikenellaceae bacterium]